MIDTGFPSSSNRDATVLILGSMPGKKSLAKSQYYAHPQNAFWPIMAELFQFDVKLPYELRLEMLREHGIALWDVAFQCIRPGSLDSAIETESVIANDFDSFFDTHPHIRTIFFNGRKAEELFHRLVLPELKPDDQTITRHLLPSTSPANAGLSRTEKLAAWRIVHNALENG